MSEIKFEWESGIEEVCSKLKDKKLIGIQLPDGLKVKSHTITKKIKDLTGANVILWLSLIHISEPTRQEAISYAVFCLKKKKS